MSLEYLPNSEKSKCETIHAIEQRLIVSLKVLRVNSLVPRVALLGGGGIFKRQCLVEGH